MKNLLCVGLCWAMTFGLVAVVLGQQQSPGTWRNAPPLAPQTIDATGSLDAQQNPASQNNDSGARLGLPAPDRSLLIGQYEPAQPAADDSQRRGELGVWMGESGGPGVQILRVTQGSAADQAGLRVGDVILQVNGRGASSPQGAAQLIRRIPIGQSGTLTIWREGDQQQLQVTMRPARQILRDLASDASHRARFGAAESSASGDLEARTMRLEQQINSLTQELATMRQELAQLRTSGPVQTGYREQANQNAPSQPAQDRYDASPQAGPPAAPAPLAPPPGFAPSEEKPAKPAAEAAKPAAPPAAPSAPAAEKSTSNSLFEADAVQPKSQDKPTSDEKPKADDKGASDDLFK